MTATMESAAGQFEAGSIAEHYRRYLEPVLFAPWAERLIARAGVRVGDVVVDVASGTGAVARAAAHAAGRGGLVIATDISRRMLSYASAGVRPGFAPIDARVCSAAALDVDDGSADVVLCQQGLQFMDDPLGALRECRRVLRPGGVVAVSAWAAGEPLDPFDSFAAALSSDDRPLSNASVTMSVASIVDGLCVAGFHEIAVRQESLAVRWPTLDAEVSGVFGTPFGPLVERMDDESRADVLARLRTMLGNGGDGTLGHLTTAVLGRATKPLD